MKKLLYLFVILSMGLFSCSDWLNVQPKGQISAETLLKDELGFKEVLSGVYTMMAEKDAYGLELTCGFVDAMAQYWSISTSTHRLYDFSILDLSTAAVENRLERVWSKMYQAISNLNILLAELEKYSPADFKNYNLIKGEALGLRAYLHLDLLRLFGPVLTGGGGRDMRSIPYRTEYSNKTLSLMKTGDVLASIRGELEEAYRLLKEDPINEYGRKRPMSGVDLALSMEFRGIRMNYYAVAATLARYHLLVEEKNIAAQYAQEVIDSKIFTLAQQDVFSTNTDRLLQSELIFGLYMRRMPVDLSGTFNVNFSLSTEYQVVMSTQMRSAIFNVATGSSSEDLRLLAKMWSDGWGETRPTKYVWNNEVAATEEFQTLLPMIRLSEMYHIVAESLIGTDNAKSCEVFNVLRTARRLNTVLLAADYTDNEKLYEYLVWEARRDFLAEGKMFYLYKRLNRNILTLASQIPAASVPFVMPVPKKELEYGAN